MTRRTALLLTSSLPFFVNPAFSFQGGMNRKSPHDTASLDLGSAKLEITYGRPSLKGRTMSSLTPDGEVWRFGADEATKLTVSAPVTIGSGLMLAPGSYSLFAITGPDKWTMIVNKVAKQWGAFKYDKSQDLGRFDLPVTKNASPVEEFTITLKKKDDNTADATFSWGAQSVSTPIKTS